MSEEIKNFPLLDAYTFTKNKGLTEKTAEIRGMDIEWDKSYNSSVRKGFIIQLLMEKGLLDEFIEKYWPTGKTPAGENRIRRVLRIAKEYEDFLSGDSADEEASLQEEEASFEFALESHLRDFLAKDLERIEPGLKLYQAQGRTGIEYSVDGGRIDILAVDRSGRFVVIELKLSQGRNKVLGQLLYYMGWVDANLGKSRCRGIVIASEISKELLTAVSRAPDVSLYKYKMNFSVEPVSRET